MWLMEERQKVETLLKAVATLQQAELDRGVIISELTAQLERHKARQITLEARVQRLESAPSTQARRAIPSASLSPSVPSADSSLEGS